MLAVFVLLILALLVKDATPLGDRYVLRALSEGMALLAGCGWFALSGVRGLNRRHALLGLYVGVLVFAIPQTASPLYVALQIVALVAIILFSLAFLDAARQDPRLTVYATRTMLVALTAVCIASLMMRYWQPGVTYEQTFEGARFRGLFSKPAMMGAASGLLLGLGLFVLWHRGVRLVAIAAGLPCLVLTGSRTFWAAALVSMAAAALRYVRWRWTFVPVGAVLIAGVVCIGMIADLRLTSEQQAKLLRQDSIMTFSGRTSIWTQALQRYWERPWLGYGFTAGGMVLDEGGRSGSVVSAPPQSPSQGAATLHNGYLQALLDSGGIGASVYVLVIVSALACFLFHDRRKQYAAEFYCLLFLAVANLGETVIFGAAVLHGVWFWYLCVLALTISSTTRRPPSSGVQHKSESQLPAHPGTKRRFALVQSREAWS
jgi:O-antigen ligase